MAAGSPAGSSLTLPTLTAMTKRAPGGVVADQCRTLLPREGIEDVPSAIWALLQLAFSELAPPAKPRPRATARTTASPATSHFHDTRGGGLSRSPSGVIGGN